LSVKRLFCSFSAAFLAARHDERCSFFPCDQFGKENTADKAYTPGLELLSLRGGYAILPRDTAIFFGTVQRQMNRARGARVINALNGQNTAIVS
jgi:hypothetical protein